jgi:ankyrin repeat protein
MRFNIKICAVILILSTLSACSTVKPANNLAQVARSGSMEQLLALISSGADVKGYQGGRALYDAAEMGHYDAVELLIAHGADVNSQPTFNGVHTGSTPLLAAVGYNSSNFRNKAREEQHVMSIELEQNRLRIIELLIRHGANVNLKSQRVTPMHRVATRAIAELLIKHGANIQGDLQGDGESPLIAAIRKNRKDVVEVLIAHGADVNPKNLEQTDTPLIVAVSDNRIEMVQLLIDNGADVNLKNRDGRTNLVALIHYGNRYGAINENDLATQKEILKLLITSGAHINAKNKDGSTPLETAIFNAKVDLAILLLEHGAKTNEISSPYAGETALYYAIQTDSAALVELMIKKGAQVNVVNKSGLSPLTLAIVKKQLSIAQLLINHGAEVDVNFLSKARYESSHYSFLDDEILSFVLKHGANINSKDHAGDNVLWSVGYDSDLTELLLKYGADINIKNSGGRTVLHVAARFARDNVAKWLVEHGANVNIKDDAGLTPLFHATQSYARHFEATPAPPPSLLNNSPHNKTLKQKPIHSSPSQDLNYVFPAGFDTANSKATVELLLAHGADIGATDFQGQGLLHVAPTKDIVDLLISRGIAVNTKRNRDGATALHLATKSGRNEVVKVLLAHGADINATDKSGNTPLHMAKEWQTASLLLDHSASVNAKNNNGIRPLMHFMGTLLTSIPSDGGAFEIIRILVQRGADVNQGDRSGNRPLTYLMQMKANPAYSKFVPVIKSLTELFQSHGAKVAN